MFDDIIVPRKKPSQTILARNTRGEVADSHSDHIHVIYVDPNDGEFYYFKYFTKKKFRAGDEVEIIFQDGQFSSRPQQICEQWTIDNKRKSEVCVEEVKKIKT